MNDIAVSNTVGWTSFADCVSVAIHLNSWPQTVYQSASGEEGDQLVWLSLAGVGVSRISELRD